VSCLRQCVQLCITVAAIRRRSTLRLTISAALLIVLLLLSASPARNAAGDPFYMGVDTSLTTFMQQQNVTFTDNGVAKPLDQLLYDRGANLFRLRIFVNPQTTYTNQNSGAIQTQAYDIALAQQIKADAPNAKLLLDFQYSDTWADPGKQTKPAAWANLSLAQLQSTVQTYTQDTLLAFKNAGVMPDMVQVGNEISTGMLWGTTSNPAGGKLVFSGSTTAQRTSWQNLGSLLNSAIQGVRAAQGTGPKIDVAIHIDQGDQDGHPKYYFDNLTNPAWGNVSDFDIVGVSYYPTTRDFHSFSLLQSNLNAMADSYPSKKLMVLETAYPWQTSSVGIPQWPSTPAGQQQFLSDLQNMVANLHNNAGAGLVYWYPESVQVPSYAIYNGGATALFDANRSALPALSTFGITLVPGDFDHDGLVNAADYVLWRKNGGTPADYAAWRSNFGNPPGSGSAVSVNSAVPEPTTMVLLMFATGAVCLLRRRAV
jgi:arabinogalactan endo-1,4-beta-galactosidase